MIGTKPLVVILLILVAARGWAQEHQHGSDEKLGTVNFATSCNPGAQSTFNRAVALLHSFQFSRAIDGIQCGTGSRSELWNRLLGHCAQRLE